MDSNRNWSIAVFGGSIIGLLAARSLFQMIHSFLTRDAKTAQHLVKKWEPVGKVTSLLIYPIKSCHRVEVQEADCTSIGLRSGVLRDRCFLVVNKDNNFLHARLHPHMVLIQANVHDGVVELSGPDMEPLIVEIPDQLPKPQETVTVRVWGDEVSAVDCGDAAATWLSRFIFKEDTGARLVYYPLEHTSRQIKTKSIFPWMKKSDGAVFHDQAPYLLMTEESISDLNEHYETDSDRVSVHNFRPVIVVSGSPAYKEDGWTFVKIGQEATFRFMKPCDRCVLTTIDPKTGIKHPGLEPLKTLRKYRLAQDPETRKSVGESPFLGVSYALEKPGHIRVGDTVYVGSF